MTAAPKKPKTSQPKKAQPTGSDQPTSTDDIKAKFREALAHKEHHDAPNADDGTERLGVSDTHGPVQTKRTFRRKTG